MGKHRATHRYFTLLGQQYTWMRAPTFEAAAPEYNEPARFLHYILTAEVAGYHAYIDWEDGFAGYENRTCYMWWVGAGRGQGMQQYSWTDPWGRAINPLVKGTTRYQRDAMRAAQEAMTALLLSREEDTMSYFDLTSVPAEYWEQTVACPICQHGANDGVDWVHLSSVRVEGGGLGVEVTGHMRVQPIKVGPGGRGSTVAIVFHCESGHQFALSLTVDKGKTFTACTRLPDYDIPEDNPPQLWRD